MKDKPLILYVVEVKSKWGWTFSGLANVDGRMARGHVYSLKYQFPRAKFRIKKYGRI